VLNEKQKEQLEALFMAPRALAELLRTYPQKLSTPTDASVFLLRNRKELDGCINPEARERSVDLLTELLLQWSDSPPDSLGIDFDDVSLTPEQKVYLPINGLRGIEVFEASQLQQQRKGRRFESPFTLFQEEKHYFVALTLTPKVVVQQPAPVPKKPAPVPKNKGRVKVHKEFEFKPGQPLPYISGMRGQPKERREPRRRVLYSKYGGVFKSGFATMNWGGLSGWGTNGGLPSLGKRSR
jgi:hypothetical protein